MNLDFDAFDRVEKEFDSLFQLLSIAQAEIHDKLEKHADGKVLKGDELVGWLGEIYTKIICCGGLVDDSHEHDVETDGGDTISVKTRKGIKSGWKRSSAIPNIEGEQCPSHLMFVHLDDNYSVNTMWLYPWQDLYESGRFKKHIVRGNFRSYYMTVNPREDDKYKIYDRVTKKITTDVIKTRL